MPNDFHQRRKNLSEAYHLALQGLLYDEQRASGATATPAALAEQLTADPSAALPFLTFEILLARRHLKHYQQRVNELEGEIERKMGFGATVQHVPKNAPALPKARIPGCGNINCQWCDLVPMEQAMLRKKCRNTLPIDPKAGAEGATGHCAYGGSPSEAEIVQCRMLRSFNCECSGVGQLQYGGERARQSGSGATETANPPELQPSTSGDLHPCAAQCGNIDAATLASITDLKPCGL